MENKQKTTFASVAMSLLAFVILGPLALFLFKNYIPPTQTFQSLGEKAFGSLSPSPIKPSELGMGGDAGAEETKEAAMYPIIEPTDGYVPELVIRYEYDYTGELPDLSAIDKRVFRRVSAFPFPKDISDAIASLKVGVLPLSALNNLYLSSVTAAEDDPNGFTVSVDPINNALYVGRNQGYWSTYDYNRVLVASDVPSDEVLIRKANELLARLQIDRSGFGEPSIDRTWIDMSVWVPDALTVQYPLIVDGREVYGLWGQPSGMGVNVNFRTNEADSVFLPGPFTLETSDYEITTDQEAILGIAKQGGMWEYQDPNAAKVYRSTLGEPDLVLAEHSQNNTEGMPGGDVFYVPALRFPVLSVEEDAPYKKTWVVVPLVKDILESGTPKPEPLIIGDEAIKK